MHSCPIHLGFSAANVFTTLSQSIATPLYVQRRKSPFSHSSVCVVLLYDFTLLSTEILLSHEHVVTGNVSSILKMMWISRKRSLLESFKAHVRVAGISEELFQKVYKV